MPLVNKSSAGCYEGQVLFTQLSYKSLNFAIKMNFSWKNQKQQISEKVLLLIL